LPQPHVVGGCVLVGVAGRLLAPVYSLTWFAAAPVERQRRDIPGDPSEVEPIGTRLAIGSPVYSQHSGWQSRGTLTPSCVTDRVRLFQDVMI
jgi:hypothetical protein